MNGILETIRAGCNNYLNAVDSKQKLMLVRRYESMVGKDGARRAGRNYHSRRRPIQCGLTIHPGSDCAYSCIYCYILDMGFKFQKPQPCELSPEELALALLYNPNFSPGRNGTYIAIGSIVEPFQPELKSLSMRYIAELARLGNPIQFSTKSRLSRDEAEMISSSCNWISPLITIITLNERISHLLEPLAPTPSERLDTISNLAKAGLKPFLFLRPVLPGIVPLEEYVGLVGEAVNHGAHGVVLGNFRVTRRIIETMRRKRIDVSEIMKRIRLVDDKQRPVPVSDIQGEIVKQLRSPMVVYKRTCCASAYCADLKQCTHESVHRISHRAVASR